MAEKKKKDTLAEQYDKANSENKTLEQQQNEIVQNYQMKEGDYKILITVYEANDLLPRAADYYVTTLDKSACDAFVEVEIRGQIKKTPVRKQTNNPIWQEPFYFTFDNMSVQELDRSKIIFNVYDKNHFIIADSHLGQFQLDWTNVYFRRFHEIYRGWLTLSDPKEEIEGPVGYLLVSIAVLGPDDKIMVHDSAFIKDPLTTIEDTVTNTKVPLIDYSLNIEVYRAESLIPLDLASRSVDAYVVAKFSGNKVSSEVINSLNPEWNEALKIGTGVPNKTKYIVLEVWNRNRLSGDDLIGAIKIPFIDVYEDKYINPRWGHLYGPPMCAQDVPPVNYATKMQVYGQDLGSHYRGRILFKVVGKKYIHGKNGTNKLQFKFPFKPTPVVPLKTYTLGIELIEGFQLPERQEAVIHVAIGQYMIKSKTHKVERRMCEFMEILEDKKVQFAEDIEQVPDIIIYFCDGRQEKNRISFKRIKASQVVTSSKHKHPHIYELDGDKSLHLLNSNQIGGYITCKVNLYSNAAPQFKQIQSDYKEKTAYQLMFYLYKGEGFPPANIQGDCDPFIKFNCYGQDISSKPIEGSFNPFWREVIPMQVSLQDVFTTNITKGIVCEAFDHEETGKHQYIGSFLIALNSQMSTKIKVPSPQGLNEIEFLYQKPKWYYVKNPHVQIGKNVFGKVLLSVALFKKEDITRNKIPAEYLGQKDVDLIPTEDKSIQVYLIGLRDIRDASKKMLSKGDAQVVMKLNELSFSSGTVQLKRSGCEINKLIDCKIKIPKNKSLTPYIDFKVLNNNSFYGFNSISLYKLLPKLKEKEGLRQRANQEDSQDTILDVQGLEQQLQMLKQKRKLDKLNHELGVSDDKLEIEELNAPCELGFIKKNEKADSNEIQFANLITVFQSNYQTHSDFDYVRALEKMMDNRQVQEQKKNEERFVKGQQSLKHLDSRFSKFQQGMQQGSRQSNFEDSFSKAKIEIKDKNEGKQGDKRQTVFDKLKKKIQQKQQRQKSKAEMSINKSKNQEQLSFNKSKNEEPIQKPIKEMTHNEIKIEVYDEQVLPLERNEEFPENFSHRSERKSQLDPQQARAREKKKRMVVQANNEESIIKHHKEASNRYTVDNRASKEGLKSERSMQKLQQQGVDVHIEIKTDQQFSDMPVEQRVINYNEVKRVMEQEEKDQKQARERDEQYKFANAVKLTLFGWNRKKKRKDIETYDDYETQQGEDLNIIPEWYKGRKILTSDFQDLNFKGTKIQTIPLFGGQKIENSIFHAKKKESAGHIKMIVMSETTEVAKEKQQYYTKLLKPKEYYCRIYILKGKSLISGYDVKPSTFLRFTYADQTVCMKDKTYRKDETNPEYYICYELPLNLPGPAMVKVEVIQTHNIFGKLIERILGYTQIDLEQRYFMKRWHLYEKKPIELRNLYSQYGMGSQGRIQTFIDLIQKKKWLNTPAHPIAPPPFDKYQLRVIVWKTDDCVFKNIEMESNDIYVRATVGTCQPQETDTHWACRSVGNFNYRLKFPIFYPQKPEDMYSDVFTVQIWDRDLVGYNNLIGQKRINLHKIHRIIEKAVKRRKPVQGKMKIKQKNYAITDRFWFDVINSKEKDEFGIPQPQGRVQLSFELVPFEQAQAELSNGFGRSEPNVYPTLQDPEGRLQFDFFSPLSFIKQIIGPKLFARWCCRLICCLAIVLLVLFGYIFLPTLLAVKI